MSIGNIFTAKEVIKAMSVVLIKADCPNCKMEALLGFGTERFQCSECFHEFNILGFDTDNANRRNLVSWAKGNKRIRIGKKIVKFMFRMQEGCCAYCSHTLPTNYHVEHIVPLNFGGSNKIDNLVLSCVRCNLVAGAKVFMSFMAKRSYILDQIKRRAS